MLASQNIPGSPCSEPPNGLAARAALGEGSAQALHRTCHVPISNTAAAVQLRQATD